MEQHSNIWSNDSMLLKLVFITVLTLALLIPSAWVQDLIAERAGRQQEIIKDISDKWSGDQLMAGPVLIIPYKKQIMERDTANRLIVKESIERIYILPHQLNIKAKVSSRTLHRGIFDIGVYDAVMSVDGSFDKSMIAKLQVDSNSLLLDKAKLVFALSDLKGLKSNPVIHIQGKTVTAEPITDVNC